MLLNVQKKNSRGGIAEETHGKMSSEIKRTMAFMTLNLRLRTHDLCGSTAEEHVHRETLPPVLRSNWCCLSEMGKNNKDL